MFLKETNGVLVIGKRTKMALRSIVVIDVDYFIRLEMRIHSLYRTLSSLWLGRGSYRTSSFIVRFDLGSRIVSSKYSGST
jgi:hypothetical protein